MTVLKYDIKMGSAEAIKPVTLFITPHNLLFHKNKIGKYKRTFFSLIKL